MRAIRCKWFDRMAFCGPDKFDSFVTGWDCELVFAAPLPGAWPAATVLTRVSDTETWKSRLPNFNRVASARAAARSHIPHGKLTIHI